MESATASSVRRLKLISWMDEGLSEAIIHVGTASIDELADELWDGWM